MEPTVYELESVRLLLRGEVKAAIDWMSTLQASTLAFRSFPEIDIFRERIDYKISREQQLDKIGAFLRRLAFPERPGIGHVTMVDVEQALVRTMQRYSVSRAQAMYAYCDEHLRDLKRQIPELASAFEVDDLLRGGG